ncbi:hypothetical protein OC842_007152 [Tilletia horrida]|uniref:Thioesterase domain-containing protein n=1 Tax=Tilletia horrida TaxID=155126 RepID=A0AAN6G492_9BASI|nr:hypothetical protein OC842_007152 [Tilletia horrida]
MAAMTSQPLPIQSEQGEQQQQQQQEEEDTLHADIEQVHSQLLARSPIYHFLLQDIRILSVRPAPAPPQVNNIQAAILAHLVLAPQHLNSHASLHGAVAATIVDWAGGIVIASLPRSSSSSSSSALTTPRGVSVDIHLRYLSPAARLGDTLLIRAFSRRIGRSLGFVTVELSVQKQRQKQGAAAEEEEEICVVEASHTKYIVASSS